MNYAHQAVLANEVLTGLQVRPGGLYVDGTLGGGGHAALICEGLGPEGTLLGIDRDIDAITAATEGLKGCSCQCCLIQRNFAEIKGILQEQGLQAIDGALLDLGVSSWQLDNPDRGFSYQNDGPLDMRMDGGAATGLTARTVVNSYSAEELSRIIRSYGEERWASRIGQFIVRAREKASIETTGQLTEIIKNAIPAAARREGPHPAKRTFQAIRIEVNDELGRLEGAVNDFIDVLKAGGRLVVITFHSLEDRIVKEVFKRRENPCVCPPELPCVCGRKPEIRRVGRKPVIADETEKTENPRARSAKLRVAEKI
jgi:16S rRNA (cytosine1402-N4)-methyltransferase